MNLGQLAQLLTNAPATCEACGNSFTCGATLKGCWCSEIKLSEETRAELKTSYAHCLCRQCLENIAAAAQEDR